MIWIYYLLSLIQNYEDWVILLNLGFMAALNSFLDLDLSSFPWKVGIIPSCGNSRNWEVMEEEGVWKVWVNQRDQ